MNADPTRILVVDDSALYRQSIRNVLLETADANVVGMAKDGLDALDKIEQLRPELLTLDVQMPDMNGIDVLRELKRRGLTAKAIMVSSFTAEGTEVTTEALLEGAFDFILKPSSNDSAANRQQLQDALREKITAFREGRHRKRRNPTSIAAETTRENVPTPTSPCQAVILGASTGGPSAIKHVLSRLPPDLAAPVLVVQHMPANYTRSLAGRLDDECQLSVCEGSDQMEVDPGKVIIAPGGQQMQLTRGKSGLVVRVNDDPPENGIRPSVDYLVRSAANLLQADALAVIMTGMGRDGLAGCRQLKQAGGYVFAQCQDDCVVYGMPKAVIDDHLADRTLPLAKIAPAIVRHVKRSRR